MCVTHFTCTKSVHQTLENLQHAWHVKEPLSGSPVSCQHKALKMGCCIMSEYSHNRTFAHTTIHLDMAKKERGKARKGSRLINILIACTVDYTHLLHTVGTHCSLLSYHSLVQFPFAYFDLSSQ